MILSWSLSCNGLILSVLGVTSLGMGGTQVHLLLEHFQRDKPLLPVPLVLSAATQQELDVLIQQLSEAIDKAPPKIGVSWSGLLPVRLNPLSLYYVPSWKTLSK